MRIQCPNCRAIHEVADQMAGTRAQCRCGKAIQIPHPPKVAPAAEPRIRCPACQRVHAVTPAMQGTAARCACGNVIQIPGPAATPGYGSPGYGSPGYGAPGYAVGPYGVPSAPVSPTSGYASGVGGGPGSLLEELTQRDFEAASASQTPAVAPQMQRDAEILRKYVQDTSYYAGPVERPSAIVFLGTLKILGLFFSLFMVMGIILIWVGVANSPQNFPLVTTSAMALGTIWYSFLLATDIGAVAGMFSQRPWGWFAATYTYFLGTITSAGTLLATLVAIGMRLGDSPGLLVQSCGRGMYVAFGVIAILAFYDAKVIAYFRLKMNPIVAGIIVFAVALLTLVMAVVCLIVFAVTIVQMGGGEVVAEE